MTLIHASSLTTPDGAQLAYLTLGDGPRRMIYLPGAGDGIARADEAKERLLWWLKARAGYFSVLYLSRRDPLPVDWTLEDQARDVIWAVEQLGWAPALLEAQSAGGPVGQLVAAKRPDLAPLLVLSSTAAWLDEAARALCQRWLDQVLRADWEGFFEETTRHLWQDARYASLRPFRRLLTGLATPSDPRRLAHILGQLLTLDHRALLPTIKTPVLVSAGEQDKLFGPQLQRQMSALLPQSELILTPGFGHGHDMENPQHVQLVAAFARLHNRRLRPSYDALTGS